MDHHLLDHNIPFIPISPPSHDQNVILSTNIPNVNIDQQSSFSEQPSSSHQEIPSSSNSNHILESNQFAIPSPVEQTTAGRRGKTREKVPLAPGHTLAHWNAEVQLRKKNIIFLSKEKERITPSQLASHNKESDAWIAVNGKVFDVTRYLHYHPGGVQKLMMVAGKDATSMFYKYHAWVNYENLLAADVVGTLVKEFQDET